MEKLMYKHVYKYPIKYQILSDYQYSTIQTTIEIVDNIITNLEVDKHVAGLYLDLSKAFNTTDHTVLLYKLNHYGCRGKALE